MTTVTTVTTGTTVTKAGESLRIEALTKRFGHVTAVDGVDLTLGPAEILALVGPSGCGKSTLLRLIAGLLPADSGRIDLDGQPVDDGRTAVPPERRRIGLVFQDHSLFPHLRVAENVAFGIRRVSRAERARRVDEVLALVALDGLGRRYPHELSGGQRQRVAVARALAPRPRLVLLDEPFASLDHNLRVQVRADVVAALRATGTPAVLVTHDQREALTVGDRVGILRAGRIVGLGHPVDVFDAPADQFVGSFLGEASFLPLAPAPDGGWRTALGEVAARGPVDPTRQVAMVRPDDVRFECAADGDAEVVGAAYHGATWLYQVRLPDGATVLSEGSHLTRVDVGTRGRVALTPGHKQVVVAISES